METDDQGYPTSSFGKYLFGGQFEIWSFRNICCKISCLPASPRIFEHLKNGIIAHFPGIFTGLPGKPSHKMGFRSSVSKSGHPGEGKHVGLVRRNDVLTNGFIGFSLA